MFCTLADIEIRRRTSCQRGLIGALRGVLVASGGIGTEWSPDRTFKAGDDAVGVPVLEELYAKMKSAPMIPDLDGMWKGIGVEMNGDAATFDDSAPEGAIRRAITSHPSDGREACGNSAHRD